MRWVEWELEGGNEGGGRREGKGGEEDASALLPPSTRSDERPTRQDIVRTSSVVPMAAARRIQLTLRLHSSIYVPLASLNDKLSLLFSWDITRADDPTDASSHARCGMATNDAVWEELLAWITEHNNGVSPAPHVRMEQSRDGASLLNQFLHITHSGVTAGRGLVAVSNIEVCSFPLQIPDPSHTCHLARHTPPFYPREMSPQQRDTGTPLPRTLSRSHLDPVDLSPSRSPTQSTHASPINTDRTYRLLQTVSQLATY